ncbi:TPA: hypothetical protein NY308_001953 [Proteus mirabilis]|nr:hypothetical protein [Proteus mirabilis]HBC5640155.1 hypothetical protein [Proteus mirabilis]HBC5643391.1 hypothetical protein [Proteus mirabilis]HCK1902201.1 hypothetical protein [Proteus mirabilis]HEJ0231327.1 hypothetical protein [Proteus mirabilis]
MTWNMSVCRLCKDSDQLELSHILPRFIFKHAKLSALTGHLRTTENPNKVSQDGKKVHFLCKKCESMFSGWESYFSKEIFYPLEYNEKKEFEYDNRLNKYLASVSFRVLSYIYEVNLNDFSYEENKEIIKAINNLRGYLLGYNPHPKEQRQLLILLDKTGTNDELDIYLTKAIEFDFVKVGCELFTYVKYLRFLHLCPVKINSNRGWKSARINNSSGMLSVKDQELPNYIQDKINNSMVFFQEKKNYLSLNQKQKIENRIIDSLSRKK